jgi:hypothetical protein
MPGITQTIECDSIFQRVSFLFRLVPFAPVGGLNIQPLQGR